jgi:hypothetical protein
MKLLKYLIPVVIIASVLPGISSCKKGEDDPFISFRSRKARMEGEWKVVSAYYKSIETGPGADSYSWTFDGSKVVENDNNVETTYKRYWTWKIEKDGKFKSTDAIDGDVREISGRWDFLGGNSDVKKKSRIMLLFEQIDFSSTGTYFISSSYIDDGYDLIELRHDRMVWRYSYTYDSGNGATISRESEMVFEEK